MNALTDLQTSEPSIWLASFPLDPRGASMSFPTQMQMHHFLQSQVVLLPPSPTHLATVQPPSFADS
jgi:hypothetical protein